jgi:ornithine carbamoyltransferase
MLKFLDYLKLCASETNSADRQDFDNRGKMGPPMTSDLKTQSTDFAGRHFITLKDFTAGEILELLDLSAELKAARERGQEVHQLSGKVIALIFEKDSTRTRCAFEAGALHQGAHTTYLGPSGTHIGSKETVADTARVLGGMFDAIQYRGFAQETVETLAKYAGVPVYNGLTDTYHPTQILADFLTMMECCEKPLNQQALTFLGDGANNMANSLLIGSAKLGIDFRLASPENLRPCAELVAYAEALAEESGAKILLTDNADQAVKGTDFLYADVWLSMGQSADEWDSRVTSLMPFRVDTALVEATGNPRVKFLHCLPAYHDDKTSLGAKFKEQTGFNGIEVSNDVFESEHSVVFQQSANRLHTIKAVMVATLGKH